MIALGVATCLFVFSAAEKVSRLLGVTGNVVLSRLLGVILAGLAVQFIINGIESLLRPPPL
jgi:multiple antibiotic resistance protein